MTVKRTFIHYAFIWKSGILFKSLPTLGIKETFNSPNCSFYTAFQAPENLHCGTATQKGSPGCFSGSCFPLVASFFSLNK